MLAVDNYTRLYEEKLQEAEWYKKPAVKTAIKTTMMITIIVLVTLSSLSGHALRFPLSSIGTIGHNLLGFQGLIALTAAGFTASVILFVLLMIYQRQPNFRVSDYIQEDKGFLYVIKDKQQKIKGYLYATIHMMPFHWKGLNSKITEKLDSSRKVLVECHEVAKYVTSETTLFGGQPGIDFKIMDYANSSKIKLEQFETYQKQMAVLESWAMSLLSDKISNCRLFDYYGQTSMSQDEMLDRQFVTWQIGDEGSVSIYLAFNHQDASLVVKDAWNKLLHVRNTAWMPTIQEELKKEEEKPIFIAVGSAHLFDYDIISSVGLITRISNAGYTVTKVDD